MGLQVRVEGKGGQNAKLLLGLLNKKAGCAPSTPLSPTTHESGSLKKELGF